MDLKSIILPPGQPLSGLSTGLSIFLTLLFVINFTIYPLNDHIVLKTDSLFTFDLNRISLYPLAHLSVIHLLFNVLSLFTPLTLFERTHGTLYTGVILNLLAVFTGIIYCLVGYVFFPNVEVGGASGWCFSFFGYFAVKESRIRPSTAITSSISFPTLYVPVLLLLIIGVVAPGSSFAGHSIGLALGYFMGFKEDWVMKITPPSSILKKIENRADPLINMIPFGIKYYREAEVERSNEYTSLYESGESSLPLHNSEGTTGPGFQGQGRVLGN